MQVRQWSAVSFVDVGVVTGWLGGFKWKINKLLLTSVTPRRGSPTKIQKREPQYLYLVLTLSSIYLQSLHLPSTPYPLTITQQLYLSPSTTTFIKHIDTSSLSTIIILDPSSICRLDLFQQLLPSMSKSTRA